MGSLEERITTVEAQTDGHTRAIDRLHQQVADLRAEMHDEFRSVRTEIADLRRDMLAGDAALRVEINDLRTDMNRRFDQMDQKFTWFVSTQIATLLAVVGELAGALYR